MASHHHHRDHGRCRRHNHHESIPRAAAVPATSLCHCCSRDSNPRCNQPHHLPPPSLDNLLGLVAAYLEQQLQETQCCDETHFCETPCRSFNGFKGQRLVHQQKNFQREYDHFVLSCLLQKIEDLEFSFNRFSASSDRRHGSKFTVRDSAARVIQTHFRSYLVRRSRSLRQLKELAAMKSSFLSLKSSVSGKTHFPSEAVSREAMDLLMQLDSIQSRDDPMIREGKRSLSRDLVRFLQYVDGCAFKRHEIIRKSAKDMSFIASNSKCRSLGSKRHDLGSCKDKNTEKLKKRMEKIFISCSNEDGDNNVELEEFHFVTDEGEHIPIVSDDNRKCGSLKSRNGGLVNDNDEPKSRVARTVRFNKNGNVYQVYKNAHEPSSSGDDDSVDAERILVLSSDNGMSHSSKTRNGVLVKGSGRQTGVVKTVSFDEKGNVYRVYGDTPESSASGDDDSSTNGSNYENGDGRENGYVEVEDIKYVPKENEGAEEETHSEDEEESSSQGSEGEITLARNSSHPEKNDQKREFQGQNGGLMFSPPMPLKMEP